MGSVPHTGPNQKMGTLPLLFFVPYDVTPSRASSNVMIILQTINSIHSLAPTTVTPLLCN